MKKTAISTILILLFLIEGMYLISFSKKQVNVTQDMILVNEVVQSVQMNWNHIEEHQLETILDYVVINQQGEVLFQTKFGISQTIHDAIIHRDTIVDVAHNQQIVGKIIIYNNSIEEFQVEKQKISAIFIGIMFLQVSIYIGYMCYLHQKLIQPFQRLQQFAKRIAGGNLDIPLTMDRDNIFGAFTESFDIMRSELKKAKIEEEKAKESKKELVAKLSHDIKTPIASIKATSELGVALSEDEKIKTAYTQIIQKADQVNALITNLFTATLEELKKLSVNPTDMESSELMVLLQQADYLHKGEIPVIPQCFLYADKFRLQQVFDNIFNNSYKYSNTNIEISTAIIQETNASYFCVTMEDYGGGVCEEELPYLKEKFRRGSNQSDKEGAGLGLYISDYFMREMNGALQVENGEHGLKVSVKILFSGRI